jgi:hypothetical protein
MANQVALSRSDENLPLDERRLALEERRLALEGSFARKWLPTTATLMVGVIAGVFGYVQQQGELQATERARIEATRATEQARTETHAKDEREWSFKVVEMYFGKRELFDLTSNPAQGERNLRMLAAVAPVAVQGVLDAERASILPPTGADDASRLTSLAAVAGVQSALLPAKSALEEPAAGFHPADFTIYLQFPEGGRDTAVRARGLLSNLGYRVPGIEQVAKAPSRIQVRYYRQEQRTYAGALAVELGKQLSLPASADNAILVTTSRELPSGILEVWLPSQ